MSEYDDLIEESLSPEERVQAIAEDPSASLPPMMTAADLLPPEDDPLASLPSEPPDDDTPPDEAVPAFIVVRNKYGPGSHGVYLSDGTAVGIWLSEEHPSLSGAEVQELLLGMGMEGDLAAWYGKVRDQARQADASLRSLPGVERAMEEERERVSSKQLVQKAFLDAHKKRKGEG